MALPCKNLNLNLYRVFYTVAKTKSFSESSRALHISQPAISKHIQNLEYELNTLLFYRTNRGIELTPEAKELLVYVEKAWNYLCLGEKQLQESKDLSKGKISIGVPTFIGIYYLNSYVKEFMHKHPGIVIKMANRDSNTLIDLMVQHTLDILFIPETDNIPKEFKTIDLIEDKYCFAYSKEKISVKNINSLEELVTYPFLLPVKTTERRKELDEIFNNKNIDIEPIMELDTNESMLNYIKEGMGIGYILSSVAKYNDLEIIETEELPKEKICLIYNESTWTSSTKEFINLVTSKDFKEE